MTHALMPGGFVLHKLTPPWLTKGSRISAWFDLSGNVSDAEVLNRFGGSRSIKCGTVLWKFAEAEGKRFAAVSLPIAALNKLPQ